MTKQEARIMDASNVLGEALSEVIYTFSRQGIFAENPGRMHAAKDVLKSSLREYGYAITNVGEVHE